MINILNQLKKFWRIVAAKNNNEEVTLKPAVRRTRAAALRDIAVYFINNKSDKAATVKEILNYYNDRRCIVAWKYPKKILSTQLSADSRFIYDKTKRKWILRKHRTNKDKEKLCLKI